MKQFLLISTLLLLSISLHAQDIWKPIGCFAGTNGINPDAMAHPETRGVLLVEKWSNIELSPGNFDFTLLDNKIATATNANLKYSLAIAGGAFGSPSWLIDDLGADHFDFQYQGQNWMLPLWWDTTVEERLDLLITAIGNRYAQDTSLSHVYVSQMTVNGIEGHLNGINMSSFTANGYTGQKWITSSKATATKFAQAFPNSPIVFEIHEIDRDTVIPSTIINELNDAPELCGRFGLAMWWISGKTSYQPDLLECIENFTGDKYAQVIGRSDQLDRFLDNSYATVFTQAKVLGIRYIEPWPYEFQHHTHDSLLHDFNIWADANFSSEGSCLSLPVTWYSFNATQNGKSIDLAWVTTNEENNVRFVIERSKEGRSWQELGQLWVTMPTETGSDYSFKDENPLARHNYYRIRQVDNDEHSSYSEVRHIDFQDKGSLVWPNPATTVITVFSLVPDEVKINDLTGKNFLHFSHPGSGSHQQAIKLSPGLYTVQLYQQGLIVKLMVQ
jgi:hypothetical protein